MSLATGTANMGAKVTAAMGLSHIAYIKPLRAGYAVFDASGRQLAVFPNYDAAFFTARQYNLDPVNVH